MDRPATGDASRVDHAVDPPGNRGEHLGDRRFVGDIGRDELEPRAEVLGGGGQVRADHGAALGQQPPRGGQADARGRAGDDERAGGGSVTVMRRPYAIRLASDRIGVGYGHP